jgi:tRNA(adenine34) deaminase
MENILTHSDHERFMALALEEARKAGDTGNLAVGAVVVRNGDVLSRGYNAVHSTFDVSAHAEAVAVRNMTMTRRQLNPSSQAASGPFAGAALYATVEPCPMCLWLTCIAGISTLVVGARHADLGIPFGDYQVEKLIGMTGRNIELITGVLVDECMSACRGGGRFTPGPR